MTEPEKPHGNGRASDGSARRRVKSGIPRLDYILKGGLFRGGFYSVFGPPGGGKTILCNQLCFNNAELEDSRAVYMTLLMESHAKMLTHMEGMAFFRPEFIPERLRYISGYQALRSAGLDGLLDLIRRTLRESSPALFVIDGIDSARGFAPSDLAYREFLHSLQSFTSVLDCTLVVTSPTESDGGHPENALSDGILELSDRLDGPRAVRELTVHKFRGSDYLRGKHEVEIRDVGMVIHPRTEIQFDKPPEATSEERVRMGFGVPKLDEMLAGGLLSGSTTALIGAPGTGKTVLGLHFLIDGAKRKQKGIYFGFYEPPPRLCEKAEAIGLPLRKYVDNGMIELIWQPPLEHYLDSLAEQLLEKVQATKEPRRRLFIDGIEGFRAASVYPERMPRFLSAFTNQLRTSDVTSLITEELELFRPDIEIPNPELANVVENVLLLRYVELRSQLYRLVSIMKMRESRYDTSIREFRITDDGIEVADSFRSAEAILTGQAKVSSASSKAWRRR